MSYFYEKREALLRSLITELLFSCFGVVDDKQLAFF